MLMPEPEGELGLDVGGGVDEPVEVDWLPTLIATSVAQEAPPVPQALTCRVWAPDAAETFALIEVACTIVVLP